MIGAKYKFYLQSRRPREAQGALELGVRNSEAVVEFSRFHVNSIQGSSQAANLFHPVYAPKIMQAKKKEAGEEHEFSSRGGMASPV